MGTAMDEDPGTADRRERIRALLDDDPGPVLRLPDSIRRGRRDVSGRAVRGVLVVVVVALAVLAARAWMAQRESTPEPAAGAQASNSAPAVVEAGDRGPFTSGPSAAGAGPSASGRVTVHVVGEVRRPGVVSLAAGSRVSEAVEKAGGTTRDADLGALNLARVLVDGEQVVVPEPGQAPTGAPGSAPDEGAAPTAPGAAPGVGEAAVNINTADQSSLETLPGVGPVLAQAIIEWRTQNGGFTSVEELNEVSGIGEKVFAKLAPKVTV